MISIKADMDAAFRVLSDLGRKQLPFATAMAINDTASEVKDEEEREMDRVFDRPTPFTKRALYLRRASKGKLVASVGAKPVQAGYLEMQVSGGVRRPKGRALVMPGATRLNKYGNMPKGTVSKAANKRGAFVAGQSRAGTRHLAPGVYQRTGRRGAGLKMLVSFKPRANYQPRWDFGPLAERRARSVFAGRFAARLRQAIATAK